MTSSQVALNPKSEVNIDVKNNMHDMQELFGESKVHGNSTNTQSHHMWTLQVKVSVFVKDADIVQTKGCCNDHDVSLLS